MPSVGALTPGRVDRALQEERLVEKITRRWIEPERATLTEDRLLALVALNDAAEELARDGLWSIRDRPEPFEPDVALIAELPEPARRGSRSSSRPTSRGGLPGDTCPLRRSSGRC
jgi:hypothetical protein